jgi:hypothetical protein
MSVFGLALVFTVWWMVANYEPEMCKKTAWATSEIQNVDIDRSTSGVVVFATHWAPVRITLHDAYTKSEKTWNPIHESLIGNAVFTGDDGERVVIPISIHWPNKCNIADSNSKTNRDTRRHDGVASPGVIVCKPDSADCKKYLSKAMDI